MSQEPRVKSGRHPLAELDAHLEALLDLTASQQQERLAAIAQGDPELAALLRRLLEITAKVDTVDLQRQGERLVLVPEPLPETRPDIAGYVIEHELGRGGMAVVYAGYRMVAGAQQSVAIKLLRTALPTDMERARFLNEQRILARLTHPNIATLLDAGVIGERPYLVLERIEGAPIDRVLAPTLPDTTRVLDALEAIADAVASAHALLVIHRDIKPSNVLIDRHGTVKLIDFGIAKTIGDSDNASMDRTLTGHAPMTLRYASPEQLNGQAVGVASDIYQFGLLAYRLLSQCWPWDDEEQAWPHLRMNPASEPVPPSGRVKDAQLRRNLVGDLDAIVLKCLRFAPIDRYRSMSELKDDLARHRQRKPVLARQQTLRYRAMRWIQRHRVASVLALASVALLALAVAAALLLAARSNEHAERTRRILDSVAAMFAAAHPYAENPGEARVADVVRDAEQRLLSDDDNDPLFQVLMLERLAEIQRGLQDYAAERSLLERANNLATRHALDSELRDGIALQQLQACFSRSDFACVARDGPKLSARLQGERRLRVDYVLAKRMIELQELEAAKQAFASLLESAEGETLAPLFRHEIHNSHGILLRLLGESEQAIAAYKKARTWLDPRRPEHGEAIDTLDANLATALGTAGLWAESDQTFRKLIDRISARLGAHHPQRLRTGRNYVTLLLFTGRFQTALAMVDDLKEASVNSRNRVLGSNLRQAEAATALYNGQAERALAAAREAVELQWQVHQAVTPGLLDAIDTLMGVLFETGRWASAAELAQWLVSQKPDPAMAARADTVLWLNNLATGGQQPPPTSGNSCDAADRRVFLAWLKQANIAVEAVPSTCRPARAARLAAFGWQWDSRHVAPFTPEVFASPIAQSARARRAPQPAPDDPDIERQMASLLAPMPLAHDTVSREP